MLAAGAVLIYSGLSMVFGLPTWPILAVATATALIVCLHVIPASRAQRRRRRFLREMQDCRRRHGRVVSHELSGELQEEIQAQWARRVLREQADD